MIGQFEFNPWTTPAFRKFNSLQTINCSNIMAIVEFEFKLIATLSMLAMTMFFCYLPWFVRRQWRKANWYISILNCLAGGVVLGALLLHMVPEMVEGHSHGLGGKCAGEAGYPWGCLAAGISFLVLFSIDRMFLSHAHCENEDEKEEVEGTHSHSHSHGHSHEHEHGHGHVHSHTDHSDHHKDTSPLDLPHAQHHHTHDHDHKHAHDHGNSALSQQESVESFHPHEDCHEADVMGGCHMEGIRTSKSQLQTYVFVFCLSLHSLLEGLGISGKDNRNDLFSFLVGLFAHKWIEAFALGVTVVNAHFSPVRAFLLMTFYALLTPIGIALGMAADHLVVKTDASNLVPLIMNGAAAGSFLFVACIEMIPPEFHTKTQSTPIKFVAICLGFFIMALAASFHT